MAYKIRSRDEHFEADGRPKRILALDGGGLRGILTLGFLGEIEALLRERHGGNADFRLCHYFDLIAGTSTGAIIAAALAQGWTTAEVVDYYLRLGKRIFEKSLLRHGFFRAKYDEAKLIEELEKAFGADTRLGDTTALKTGLLVVTKRLDTGSPWPLGNNPRGCYFRPSNPETIPNADYRLWQVVRASTAAPAYFDPERIDISSARGKKAVEGEFVDGGVSPFNNPALQALMFATLDGYRVGWPTGADKLLLVSVGTGARDPSVKPAKLTAEAAVNALMSLMDDSASLMETLLQWMSTSPTSRVIDRELGDLRNDLLGAAPLLSYLRYNVTLDADGVESLKPGVPADTVESLSAMDDPDNMELLKELGELAGKRQVRAGDYSSVFDLPAT
jgi:hypothetical protein